MEHTDNTLSQRVWQRIQNSNDLSRNTSAFSVPEICALAAGEFADAAACLKLSRELGGQGGVLVKLAREDQSHAGCLRGICSIRSGDTPQIANLPPETGTPAAVLRRCYANHLNRLHQYRRMTEDPDFGPAFEKMAAEEQSHCKQLLELLGKL